MGAADGPDNDFRQDRVVSWPGWPHPEHDIMAVVFAADDLPGQATRLVLAGAAAAGVTSEFDLLGPDQDRDLAARRAWRGRGRKRQPAEWGVDGVAVEVAVDEVGLADEAGH